MDIINPADNENLYNAQRKKKKLFQLSLSSALFNRMERTTSLQHFLTELQEIRKNEMLLFQVLRTVITSVPIDFLVKNNNLFLRSLVDKATISRDRAPFVCYHLRLESK